MPKRPKVLVLRTAGSNCDEETAFAFESFGATAQRIHANRLLNSEVSLLDYHILAIPGGFTYGDDIESGRIFANELRLHLGEDIKRFIDSGRLVLGICNGFQVLVKSGFLPGVLNGKQSKGDFGNQKATLISNDSGKFEARWTYLKVGGKSAWTEGLRDIVFFPVAHAEGKFIPRNKDVLNKLKQNGQIAFRYCTMEGESPSYPMNPNGSVENIAGITDSTGRILGLMPHPERHFLFTHHPFWTRLKKKGEFGDGAKIFENGVKYVNEKLL